MLLLTSLLIGSVSLLYWYVTRNYNFWKNRNVRGPRPLPLFGNIIESARRKKYLGTVYEEIYQQYPDEKVVGIYRMTHPALLIRDLDIVRDVMIKDFNNFIIRGPEFSSKGLGNNLVHADSNSWPVLRNRFSPAFTSAKIKAMFPIILEKCIKSISAIDKNFDDKDIVEVELKDKMRKYTMSNITSCAFGIEMELSNSQMETMRKLEELMLTVNVAVEIDWTFPGILKKLTMSLFPKQVSQFFDDLVKKIMKERGGVPSARKDFMDIMLEMRREKVVDINKYGNVNVLEITDEVMAAQAFVFFVGGYETSASSSSFLLYELAMNPEIQDRVLAEIDDVLEKTNGKLTFENLKEMQLLRQSFDETLRLYPIVDAFALQRIAINDYRIAGTDVTVPKGMTVLVPAAGVHRDPQHYPNPDAFDPDRFLPENSKDRHPCAYMPFGLGPRNCIGMKFGRIQALAHIALLLSKFRVEPSTKTPQRNEIKPSPVRFVLSPHGDLCVNLIRRS